jgi:glutamine amidotransferase-like uncharacterized protein
MKDGSIHGPTRRQLLGSSARMAAGVAIGPSGWWLAAGAQADAQRPLALVYRGPASSPGIPADTARFLRTCPQRFRVSFCGPHRGDLPVNAATLARAALYVQPGGGDDFNGAWRSVRGFGGPLRDYISRGGRYLGICMGGYLAGSDPGFGLLPGNCDDYTMTRGAQVRDARNAVITVDWPLPHHQTRRKVFYQDGPYFWLLRGAGARVLARYSNHRIAAMVVPFGHGTVGVCGPHPEANRSWYELAGLAYPGGTHDLGHQLVDAVMARRVWYKPPSA